MQQNQQTYPEFRPYGWKIQMFFSLNDIEKYLRKGMRGSADSPRYRAFAATLSAVWELAHRGHHEFRGDKVHRLLETAARECEWWAPRGYYKSVAAPDAEGEKVCRRCKASKPLAEYRAVATAAQKQRNGWNPHAQYFTTSLLCGDCRKAKQQEEKRKRAKRQAPDLITSYKRSITEGLENVAKVFTKHVELVLPDGFKTYRFALPEDEAYYTERRRLLYAAREKLEQRIDDGTLAQGKPTGAWHELLTEEEKAELTYLYNASSWMTSGYKRRLPVLWEASIDPGTATKVSDPDRPAPNDTPVPTEFVFGTQQTPPETDADGTPWWEKQTT